MVCALEEVGEWEDIILLNFKVSANEQARMAPRKCVMSNKDE
jgi:hypothetical protein